MSLKRREQGPPGTRGASRRGRRRRGRETDETATGRRRATGTQAQRRQRLRHASDAQTKTEPGLQRQGLAVRTMNRNLRRSKLVGVDEQGPGVGHGGCRDWGGTGVVPLYLRRLKLVGVDEQGPGVGHGGCRDWGGTGVVPLYLRQRRVILWQLGPGARERTAEVRRMRRGRHRKHYWDTVAMRWLTRAPRRSTCWDLLWELVLPTGRLGREGWTESEVCPPDLRAR